MSELSHLKLDDREDEKVLAAFHGENYFPEVQRLAIGDVICESKSIAIERKCALDFIASMRNGRLLEQLIHQENNFAHSFLIIVGNPLKDIYWQTKDGQRQPYTIEQHTGILASLAVRFRTKILQVGSNKSFAKLCLKICEKVDDGKTVELPVVKLDSTNVPLSIICQIPGVSRRKAEALLAHFGSLRGVIEAGEGDLQQVKGIGKELAKRIWETFV